MSSVLTIRRESDAHVGFSFHIHVPSPFAAYLEASSVQGGITQLVIGRDEILAWALIDHHPVLTCFGHAVNMSRQYLIDHPEVEVSASIGAVVTKTSVNQFTATIQTGSVRVITRRPFHEIGPQTPQANRLFTVNTGNFSQWLTALWRQDGKQVAGLAFSRNDERTDLGFEIELIDSEVQPDEPKRRRVSLIQLTDKSQLWQLSACGTSNEYLHPVQALQQARQNVTAALKRGAFGESVQLVERRGQNKEEPGIFYRRLLSTPTAAVQTLIRPDFGLQFTGGGLRKTWFPVTLKDRGQEIVLHQEDEIGDETKIGAPLTATPPREQDPAAKLIFVADETEAALQSGSKLHALRCQGVHEGQLQAGKLWQFGVAEPKPVCVSESMAVWTRWDLPEQPTNHSPDQDALLPVMLHKSLEGWQLNLAIERSSPDQALVPLLRLTLKPVSRKVTFELFQGMVTAFSPALHTYVRRLQDPAAPPNEKRLSESLRPSRLVFGEFAPQTSGNVDRIPTVTLQPLDMNDAPVFRLTSNNDAIVGYVPHVRDAGIDYLSAGSKNLKQRVDTQTLRTIVERDTTHLLVPLSIRSCLILPASRQFTKANPIAALSDVLWADLDEQSAPRLAAAMALAPWVSMHDSLAIDIGNSQTRVRSLHHRNLALEQGEFAVASLDRASDGIPRGLAENVKDFLNATRDDYSIAVDSLPDSEPDAAEIINWLPVARLNKVPKAFITYRTAADGLDRAPVIADPESSNTLGRRQKLELQKGIADGTSQDWLTADMRLIDIDLDVDPQGGVIRPRPKVHVEPVLTKDKTIAVKGKRRARNGGVPLLFDGKNFSAVALDSSTQPLDHPLSWSIASGPIGIIEIDRGTGTIQSTLLDSAVGVVRLGTSRTLTLDWTAAVHLDGTVKGWVRQSGTDDWAEVAISDSAGMSVSTSAIASHADSVAILAIDRSNHFLRLLVWRPQPNGQPQLLDVVTDIDGIAANLVVDISIAFHGESILVAAALSGDVAPKIVRGTSDGAGNWTFVEIPIHEKSDGTSSPISGSEEAARSVSLGFFGATPTLAAIKREGKHWWLAQLNLAGTQFDRLDLVPIPVPTENSSAVTADRVRLISRPNGKQGLPIGCRPGWVVIANESGSLDLWLSTAERILHSVDERLAASFRPEEIRHPLVRLSGHRGGVSDLDVAWINVSGSTGSRSGLLSCGEDGAVRLWNCETAQLLEEFRADTYWMDNLGTLQDPHLHRHGTHSWTQWANRPLKLPATRTEPSGYDPMRTSILFSTGVAAQETKLETWLVRDAEDPSHLTEIGFSCESLRLRLRIDTEVDPKSGEEIEVRRWIPEPVAARSNEDAMEHKLAPSRGYTGVFGFYSMIDGTNVPASDFLPRVAGLPMFIKDIESIMFAGEGDDPWKIMSATLTAVLINPLLLDGVGATLEDIQHGDAPAFLTTAILERSLVTVELKRNDQGQLIVRDVRSLIDPETGGPQRIRWNTLISDDLHQSDSTGFRGRLKALTFTVSYDTESHRVLLNAVPEETEVQVLDGSQPIELASNASLVLEGMGGIQVRVIDGNESKHLLYRFETLLTPVTEAPESLPIKVTHPVQRFRQEGHPLSLLATDDFAENCDFLTGHEIDGQTRHVAWWDSKRGLVRSHFVTTEPVHALSYGRNLAAIGLFPDRRARTGEDFDSLRVSRSEVYLKINDSSQAELAELPEVRIAGTSEVSAVTTVTGQSKSMLVAGDESGTLHLLDPVTGTRSGEVKLATAVVEFLTGIEFKNRLVVAAICGGSIWLTDAISGDILETLLLQSDATGLLPQLVALLPSGDALHVFAALDRTILRWKLFDTGGNPSLEKKDVITAIQSLTAGLHKEASGIFFTTSDGKLNFLEKGFAADAILVAKDLPAHASLDFFQADEAKRLIAIAARGETLRVLTQTKGDGQWGDWTQTVTGHSPLPATASRVQLVRAGDDVLAFTGPANQRVEADKGAGFMSFNIVVVSASSGSNVASKEIVLPNKSRWYFSANATWMPHCATSHGENDAERHIDLYSLVSNTQVRRFSLPIGESLSHLAFAENDTDVWLVTTNTKQAHSLRLTGSQVEKILTHVGGIKDLSTCGPFAVVVGEQGVMFWEVGLGEESDKHRLLIAQDQAWHQGAVTFHTGQGNFKVVSVAATGEFEGSIWKLEFDDQWTSELRNRFEVPANVSELEYASVLGRDHLVLAGLNDHEQLERVELWLPEDTPDTGASPRWRFAVPELRKPQVAFRRTNQLGVLVGGGDELSLWRPNQLIRLTEQGETTAQLDVDLELSVGDVGFPVTAQLLATGEMHFAQHNSERTTADPMLAGVTRLGFYSLIGDFVESDRDAGRTVLVLYREPTSENDHDDAEKVPFAGSVLQSQFIRSNMRVIFLANKSGNDGLTLNCTTELTQQMTRTFSPSADLRVETLISGRIQLSADDTLGSIHFADQRLVSGRTGTLPLMGMLLLNHKQASLQGAVLCNLHPEDNRLHVEPGVYRLVPSTFSPAFDTIRSDYAYPNAAGKLNHIDLCIPISAVTADLLPSYAELSGSPEGLQWRLVGEDRIPLNLCLDQVRLPLSVSESNIPQLSHRTGLGRRLRFDQSSLKLFQGTSSTNWVPQGNEQVAVWQMQPVLVGKAGLQLAEVGVIARPSPDHVEKYSTENVLAVVRPATNDQSAVVCLGTETGISDSGKNLVSTKSLVDTVSRRILLRQSIQGASPPVYSLVPDQMLPLGETLSRQVLGEQATASALDPRLLLHGAARRLILDESLNRELVPSIADPELDFDLTALREIQVRQPTVRRTLNRLETSDTHQRAILMQEATAFPEMKRLWHQPDALQPWITSSSTISDTSSREAPFHPASLRLRLAPDKPGAMIHHRLQLARAEATESSSKPVTFVTGPQLSFALREPMQLNPPIGSSMTLIDAKRHGRVGDEPWHQLSFSWKERLGVIPVRAAGEPTIKQLDSQLPDGVPPNEVKIELSIESRNCLQLIVQINDQLVDLDRRQPLFPIYDARRAALTPLPINEEHDSLLPIGLNLESDIVYVDVLRLVGQQFVAATSDTQTRVWMVKDNNPNPARTIDWPNGSVLRLGWWAARPVALTNHEGPTRLFDAQDVNTPLKALQKAGQVSVESSQLELTRLKSEDDNQLYDIAVALEPFSNDESNTQYRLNVWGLLSDQDNLNAERHIASDILDIGKHAEMIVTSNSARSRLFVALWSSSGEVAFVHQLTIAKDGLLQLNKQGDDDLLPIGIDIRESVSLAMSLNGDETQPVLYCGRGDRTLAVIDSKGTELLTTELSHVPDRLHAQTDGGRTLVAVSLSGNQNTTAIVDGHTGVILRHFDGSKSSQGCGRLLPLGEPVLACSFGNNGQPTRQVRLYRIALAALRPGNLFLLTKAERTKLFGPFDINVNVKHDDGTTEMCTVELTAKLTLLNSQGAESCSVNLEECFRQSGDPSDDGTTMYQFDPAVKGLTFSGAVAMRVEWWGELDGRSEPLFATHDGDRPFRLIPYSATAAKMSAVISVDRPNGQGQHSQIMQRNLVFGDAADLSSGKGTLDKVTDATGKGTEVFAFELLGRENIETPLPISFDETWQTVLSLAKYHVDGQVSVDSTQVGSD